MKSKGFTLIEIVVTLTILVLLLGVVAGATILTQQFSTGEHSRVELQNEVRIAMTYFDRDIRSSDQVAQSQSECFILQGTPIISYCLVGDQLLRNDFPIAQNLVSFIYNIDDLNDTVTIHLTTINDQYGNPIDHIETYYLRDGRRD